MGGSMIRDIIVPCPFPLPDGPCEDNMVFKVRVTPGERATRDYPGTETSYEGRNYSQCAHGHEIDEATLEDLYGRAERAASDADVSVEARYDAAKDEEDAMDRQQVEEMMSYEAQYERAQSMFQACKPTCYHCSEPILSLGDCRTDQYDRLVHMPGKCGVDPSRIIAKSAA